MSRNGPPRIDPAALETILLIRLRRIGDIIMTTPAVTALKKCLPDASIDYVVEEPFRRLVEGNPNLNEVLVLPSRPKAREFLRFVRAIRRKNYDAVLDFHGGPRASLLTFLSGAKLKIGYRIKYKSFIYDMRLPRSRKDGYFHSVENHLNLVKALGLPIDVPPPLYLPAATEEEVTRVERFWEENALGRAKAVVLHIGAGNEFRDWGVSNWTQLIRRLSVIPDIKFILVGAEADKQRASEIIDERREKSRDKSTSLPISAAGRFNLIELRELMAKASLFVGPDSGPMHVAASTATPVVALFGPTLPENFAPWQAAAEIIQKDLDCRPCKQRRCITEDFRCLRRIEPEDVAKACLKMMAGPESENIMWD